MDIQETFKEMGIDEEQLKKTYKESKKFILKEWHGDIIKLCIENTGFQAENVNSNKKDKIFSLQFKNEQDAKTFEDLFNSKLMPSMTQYLSDVQKENPKHYQRSMVLETKQEGISFNIYY